MTTEVICALVTVGGTLLSALIAFFVSRTTANKEIEKMQLTWEREDIVSSDDEFAEMASAVATYVQNGWADMQRDALSKIAAIRSKEIGNLAVLLDRLYAEVCKNNTHSANTALTEVINEKRHTKSKTDASNGNKPKKK